jgi:hypothetical protein
VTPHINPVPPGAFMAADPPPLPLYYAPFVLFVVWGMSRSVAQLRSWRHACLLLWVVAGTLPLLLTNRVDAHRMLLFVIPVSLWGALGIREAARVMAHAKVPVPAQQLIAVVLASMAFFSDVNLLYYSSRVTVPWIPYALSVISHPMIPSNTFGTALADLVEKIPGPVAVGTQLDQREMGWFQLGLLERARRDPHRAGTMLDEGLLEEVSDRTGGPLPARLQELRQIAARASVILVPASRFRSAAATLRAGGLRVAEETVPGLRLLRIDAEAGAAGMPGGALQPLPTPIVAPTPTPIPLAAGPRVDLTTLLPTETTYGFAPPNIDSAWDGNPIVMEGVRYARGLGTHAWCRMTYTVPLDAAMFQAIVGLSDDAHECPVPTGVTFEVRDDQDRLLFDSGFVEATTPPLPVQVDVRGIPAITLVVTEGGNGRDCDHANWAQPAFLLRAE